jgi:NADPH:quinone reductase-like Zn-dependent oxidoreductase
VKAAVIRAHGGPEAVELADLPEPVAGPGQAVVRVRAAALNHLDLWVRKGWPGLKLAFPHVLGSDVAGVVEAVGPGVEGWKAGDEVVVCPSLGCGRCERCLGGQENLCRGFAILGEHVPGGQCQALAVPARNLCRKPASLSFEEAAAVPLTFMTAWHAVAVRAALRPGETILVHAAGSGVGVAAVQIAKLLGARVLATAGSDAKLARARALGADEVINYETQDFLAEVKRLTGKRGVDVVFEHVGKVTWEKSLLAATIGGRIVTVGATTGFDPPTDLRHVFFRQLSLLGSTMGTAAELLQVLSFVEQGKLKPVVAQVLPLAEVKRLTGKRGVDVVFEHVGKATWEKSLLSATLGGRIVTVGATTGYDPPTDLRHVFFRQLSLLGSTMGTAAELLQVLAFVEQGKLRPVVAEVLPLADVVKAQALLSDRALFGKVVLRP